MKEGERGPFFPKLRVRIKDNNSSPHGKFYRFLFPFSSKFSDLNFASYVLYIYLHTVSLGYLERLPFVNKNRKFRLETQMVQLIPSESFWKRWKSLEVFLFSRSNRNDRKNPVPFVNSHSTRCTSASFPAIRRCRCSRHFDLLLFSSSRESLGLGETPHRENPVPLRAFHSNRIFRSNGKRPCALIRSSFARCIFMMETSLH